MKLKIFSTALMAALFVTAACAQMGGDKSKRESPPASAKGKIGDATIVINYSQPSVKGREVFGDLVEYGKIWRTGANEATTFETDQDIMIEGEPLPAGKYALFTIPEEDEWTIIFNDQAEQWGAYKYDEGRDVLRIKATPEENEPTEKMTFTVDDGGTIYLDWAETRVPFTVEN